MYCLKFEIAKAKKLIFVMDSCCHCGKSFHSKKVLNYHEKITHKEENIYNCDECQKSFKHKYHLKTHKLTHEEAMSVSCRFCRKSF